MRPAWMPAASGTPTAVMLLRHGQTQLSVERRYVGAWDVPLTPIGQRQAEAAGRRLSAVGLEAIVTSPLQRARQTADAVSAACGGLAVTVDEGLRETNFGKWEGMTFAEVQQGWPAEMSAWLADPTVPPPAGESFAAVSDRVTGALGRLLDQYPQRRVLVVSHVTPIKTLVVAALLAPSAAMYRMHLDVAALCEIDYYADGPAVLRGYNDTAHLAG
jgi:ribonuclease H / adenosylcobalamin/alpha-ribazole phosphatase